MSIEHENFDNILQNKDEKDLEQYGVWVKKPAEEEAQDKEQEIDSSAFFIDDLDFADVPDIDTIPKSVDDNLNAKIDEALKSVDTPASENSAEELMPLEEAVAIDDFNIEEYTPQTEEKNKPVADEQPLDIDLSFDDNFEQIMPDFPKESTEITEVETAESKTADKTDSAAGEFEEIDASMFDSAEPLEPSSPENIDLEAAAAGVEEKETQTENIPLDAFDSPEPDGAAPVMENVDISDFDTNSAADSSTASSDEAGQSDQIYDIAVKADDETDDAEKDEQPREQAQTADVQTMSSSLLEKIMGELSLLRRDINELKEDFTALKTAPAPSAGDTSKNDEKEGGGFFADDGGDDTIALSGDELNNILTSADFTDEAEEEKEASPAAESAGKLPAEAEAAAQEPTEAVTEAAAEVTDEAFPEIELPEELMIDEAEAEAETTEKESPVPELNIEENELHEPQLDDIDFDLSENETVEEELPSEIEIPVVEDLVVDSSSEDFFEEDDTPKEIDETDVRFLAENPAETEPLTEPEAEDEKEETNQYSPVNQVFNSKQWQSEGETELSLEEEAPAELSESVEPSEPVEEKKTETVFGKNIETDSALSPKTEQTANIPQNMRDEIKSVLAYMDQLLENLPEEKIVEFAQSEHFPVYKKLFNELGLS